MKCATILALGSIASVATASSSHSSFRRERRGRVPSSNLQVRGPILGSEASNGSGTDGWFSKRADALKEIALVAKLAVPAAQVASPVEATVNTAEEQAQRQAARKAAAAKKAAAVAKAKADRAAAAKAAAEKAAAEKAAADKAAADKAAAEKSAADRKAAQVAAAKKAAPKVEVKAAKVFNGRGKGLIGFVDERCGPSGANDAEPNGSQDWLNCGISRSNPNSGWTPPSGVTLDSIVTITVEEALAKNPTFAACSPFFGMFEAAEKQTGVPAILIASFALQESTCRPDAIGDHGGAFGLMQITADKCGGAPGGNCNDPWFNILTGASYFKQQSDALGFLPALAAYNGWYPGMSYASATAMGNSEATCSWQQNLDYLTQVLSGWLLGGSGWKLGEYKNVAHCEKQ